MRISRVSFCVMVFTVLAILRAGATTGTISLKVVDANGKPIAGAAVTPLLKDRPMVYYKTRTTDEHGQVRFTASDYNWPLATSIPDGTYTVLVQAPDVSIFTQDVVIPTTTPATIVARPQNAVELQVQTADGKPAPGAIRPVVFPKPFAGALGTATAPGESLAEGIAPSDKGRYKLRIDAETSTPWVLRMAAPGIVSNCLVDLQTTGIRDGKLPVVTLPGTATVRAEIGIPERYAASTKDYLSTVSVLKLADLGEKKQIYVSAGRATGRREGSTFTAELRDLPEGEYWLQAEAGPQKSRSRSEFSKGSELQLKAGETTTVPFTYTEFDPAVMHGAGQATVRVKKQDGTPAAGERFVVRYLDREFGYQNFTTGTLDDKGVTLVRDMATTGAKWMDGSTTAPRFEIANFTEQVDDNYYGGVRFGIIRFDTPDLNRTFEFTVPPREGDTAPDITLVDPYSSSTVQLSSFRGQVVFLDFWATWCGPCQGPMAHNQKVMTEKGSDWKGKAVIVGASIDDDADTLIQHVKQNGWEKVRHLWCGGDFNSGPSKTYGIDGVPTAFLIDQQGKIVWRGHPEGFELEQRVEELIHK